MRRFYSAYILIILTFASVSVAQQKKTIDLNKINYAAPALRGDEGANSTQTKSTSSFPSSHLSPLVVVPGANALPISTKWDNATNGRSLHTLVRDPDDPKKLHFITMVAADNTENDTIGAMFTSRRVAYTFSSDGGKTWTPQVYVDSSIRLGYPDLVLYKRGGVNIPIIAAHNGPNGAGQTNWTTKLYIEQGNPGDGKFKKFTTDQKSSGGKTKDIGYPSLGLSLNQDTLYVLGCALTTGTISSTNPTQPLEFGLFSLDASRNATWLGWKNNPGGKDLKGHVESGKDLLRVAPNGKLGVMWSSDSDYVCYVESFDGGKTWTPKYAPLYRGKDTTITATGGTTPECVFAGCNGGMDFWYDQTSTPSFLWQANWDSPKSSVYFPFLATAILSWKFGESKVNVLTVYNGPDLSSGLTMFDTLAATVNTFNNVDYFTSPPASTNYFGTVLWQATPIISTNPNKWGVVYQTLQDGNALAGIDVFGDGSVTDTRLFRDIFSITTKDGGQNWSAPTPYRVSDPNSDPSVKIDYHFPSTPIFNPESLGSIISDVNFVADTSPGPTETGQAVWADNTWFHQRFTLAGVHFSNNIETINLSQNFPNPFISSTTIPLVMKNDDVVTLSVTDMLGREVAIIYHGRLSAGEHQIPFNAPNLGAGIYTYTLKTSTGNISRTMSLVK